MDCEEGGHFLGDENILNMAAARYVIRPELLDNLDQVIESDLILSYCHEKYALSRMSKIPSKTMHNRKVTLPIATNWVGYL